MTPTKRSMKPKFSNVKKERSYTYQKESESHQSDNLVDCPTRLSLLPVDVLLYIYQYLTTKDILSLSQIGDQRLTESTFSLKEANISSCRKAGFAEINTYFCTDRVQSIRKLNFNYVFSVKESDLTHLICQCKNLKELSVVHCGIKFTSIRKILRSCPFLQELSWDFTNVKTVDCKELNYPALSKLYIFGNFGTPLFNLHNVIKLFPNIKDVFVNVSSESLIAPPWIGLWLQSFFIDTSKEKKYSHMFNSFQLFDSEKEFTNIDGEMRLRLLERNKMPTTGLYTRPPYLRLRTMEEDMLSLSSCSPCSYSSLTLILTESLEEVYQSLVECVLKVAGRKLKHLSVECECGFKNISGAYRILPLPLLSQAQLLTAHDMLNTLFPVCTNITVLNLFSIHFTFGSPFKAICHLKNLEVLSISTCAFFKSFTEEKFGNLWKKDQLCEFKEVVSSCPMVQDFHLNCCQHDLSVVKDEDINPIQDWKKLKHLSIYSMIFTRCTFLKKIADSCNDFQSFSCITIFPSNSCTFYDSLKYLVKVAKNLSSIRINETRFNPVYEGLWEAIGQAKNLEEICIITESNLYVESAQIISNIKALKYLHLFHFYAKRVPDQLFIDVKKSMQENGINCIKVEKDCYVSDQTDILPKKLYYHPEPQFWCQHLHIKDY